MSPACSLDGMNRATQILVEMERGDGIAADQLLPIVYDEERKLDSV
jgi:hypothetical protein